MRFLERCYLVHIFQAKFVLVLYRQRLFENLRMLPHAPGVQMQAIPEDAVQEDSGDEEEDPDKRISSKCLLNSLFTSLKMLFKTHLISASQRKGQ